MRICCLSLFYIVVNLTLRGCDRHCSHFLRYFMDQKIYRLIEEMMIQQAGTAVS